MLLWAVFTIGYLFGVFFTLGVFLKKDAVEGVNEEEHSLSKAKNLNLGSWELFRQLTKVNYPSASALSTKFSKNKVNKKALTAYQPS